MKKTIFVGWQFQKKHTSIEKKKTFVRLFGKKKGYQTTLKAFSLAQSIFTGNSKSFF